MGLAGALAQRGPFLAVAVAATLLTLGAGWLLKSPCRDPAWGGEQYTHGCYNDIVPLYFARGFDRDTFPYLHHGHELNGDGTYLGFNEYPVLVGLQQWAAARLSPSPEAFFAWTAAFSALLAVGTTLLVAGLALPRRRALLWALAPPLALYAFHNWDLLAVFLTTLGVWGFRRQRPLLAGAALGLGAAAKLYPALLLPILGVAYLRQEGGLGRSGWRFGLAAVGAWLAVNGPFLVLDARGWWATYAFHAGRGVTYESLWKVFADRAAAAGQADAAAFLSGPGMGRVLQALVVLCVAVLSLATWRRFVAPVGAALAALCLFIVLNVFMSVQYLLWVAPFVALLPVRPGRIAFLWVSDALVYCALFAYFHFLSGGPTDHLDALLSFAVVLRAGALLAVAWEGLRVLPEAVRPAAPPPPEAAAPPGAAAPG